MVRKIGFHVAMAMTLLALPLLSPRAQAQQQAPAGQGGMPAAIVGQAVTVTETVQAVDPANRTVTLRAPDGSLQTIKAGKDVANFDQIKPGDQVKATVVEAVAIAVRPVGSPPNAGEAQTVAVAPKGAMPGAIVAETKELTAKVMNVDAQNRTVTLQGPAGNQFSFKVGPNVNLNNLKTGDDVTARYTEAVAIRVEKP